MKVPPKENSIFIVVQFLTLARSKLGEDPSEDSF